MAKERAAPKAVEKYPSPYGSHKSMVDEEVTKELNNGYVVCKDAGGHYLTRPKNLDTGLADPYRHSSKAYRDGMLVEVGLGRLVKEEAEEVKE